jgi:hypothetical protein
MRKIDQQQRVVDSIIEITGYDGTMATHSHLWSAPQTGQRGVRTPAQVTCHDDLVAAGWEPTPVQWGVA